MKSYYMSDFCTDESSVSGGPTCKLINPSALKTVVDQLFLALAVVLFFVSMWVPFGDST